jgi:hypothetical protein
MKDFQKSMSKKQPKNFHFESPLNFKHLEDYLKIDNLWTFIIVFRSELAE